ncbi:MAG: ABC transporter substrate-binding protein [Altibacter sp.]|uniref:ABC transporter substrate-binding protein n=1 Tax=Altibacter sp. TaxID=2024823 RepID=UPI001DFB4A3C|nr:ABC transporter substrate-binding protein [Altibacter sp.]MBZ0328289.1 ABC transporter substrate-binding protein [Altibacter sp.]
MKLKFKIYILGILSLLLTNCKDNKDCDNYRSKMDVNSKGETIIKLQQQWFPNSGFAGELYAQNVTDSIYNLDIEIIPGSDQTNIMQLVKSGEVDFGVAGAEQVIQANQDNDNFVIVGVINYKSLACFISKKGKNILVPKDMVGKKIGTMEGSPVHLIYQALKQKEKLGIEKKNEIPTGWVLTGFTQDDYDVYPAFINDEPITLNAQGIELNYIYPSNYDINFIGTVYFCKRELVECYPEIVQKFVNSISQGWELALKNPKKSIEYLKEYDKNIDENKELKSLIQGMEYFKGENGRILYAKEESWRKMSELLTSIGQINSFDYEKTVNTKFISKYLSEIKPKNDENAQE